MLNTQYSIKRISTCTVILLSGFYLTSCTSSSKTAGTESDVPGVVFAKRSIDAIGDPLDPIEFSAGGDLMTLVPGSASGKLQNLTADMTNGEGDVSDPEIFPQTETDSFRILFSMRKNSADKWHLYEVTVNADGSRAAVPTQLTCGDDNEVDPAYLPDGRIVFTSDRPGHLDEYERRKSALLHVLDPNQPRIAGQPDCDAGEVVQISFNQSHDRNPSVLKDGTIMFSRWEHLANVNKFTIFKVEPDGSGLFVKYGSHSGVNSFLDVRERADGKVTATMMPLSGTFEGGAIGVLDVKNEADNSETASQQLVPFQNIATGRDASDDGRYHGAYQVPDGTNRYLVSYSIEGGVSEMEDVEVPRPSYGIYMLNTDGVAKPIKLPASGSDTVYVEPVPLMAVPADQIPTVKPNLKANKSDTGLTTGVIGASSVYDSEANRALSSAVLGVELRDLNGNIDFDRLLDPANNLQVVKEVRVIEAVPSMPGVGREDIGSTNFERQKILGYAPVEADGSFQVRVPADTALTLHVVDDKKRSFKVKENWLQVRPGEANTCNGCHSPRRGDPQRLAADAIAFQNGYAVTDVTLQTPRVIDYVEDVQSIFNAKCTTACHEAGFGPAGDLDLSGDQSGVQFPISYEQLVGDMNGSGLVRPGESRQSHLIERMFGEELRAGKDLPAAGVDTNNHEAMLLDEEKLTLVEWIDLGTQFTNKEVITNPGRANLSTEVFESTILPILTAKCGGACHQAAGDSDFVLTGSAEGDFGAVAARVNVTNPANSLLLLRASDVSLPMPGTTVPPLPVTDPDYDTILDWITAAQPES